MCETSACQIPPQYLWFSKTRNESNCICFCQNTQDKNICKDFSLFFAQLCGAAGWGQWGVTSRRTHAKISKWLQHSRAPPRASESRPSGCAGRGSRGGQWTKREQGHDWHQQNSVSLPPEILQQLKAHQVTCRALKLTCPSNLLFRVRGVCWTLDFPSLSENKICWDDSTTAFAEEKCAGHLPLNLAVFFNFVWTCTFFWSELGSWKNKLLQLDFHSPISLGTFSGFSAIASKQKSKVGVCFGGLSTRSRAPLWGTHSWLVAATTALSTEKCEKERLTFIRTSKRWLSAKAERPTPRPSRDNVMPEPPGAGTAWRRIYDSKRPSRFRRAWPKNQCDKHHNLFSKQTCGSRKGCFQFSRKVSRDFPQLSKMVNKSLPAPDCAWNSPDEKSWGHSFLWESWSLGAPSFLGWGQEVPSQ